jgi:hypothetical protein
MLLMTVQCDEVRPHCLKCIRAGRECQGYRDDSPFIIRDMTSATIEKFKGEKRSSVSSESSEGSPGEKPSGFGSFPVASDRLAYPKPPPKSRRNLRPRKLASSLLYEGTVSLPVEDQAFCYFANRYAFAPTQFLDPGYLPVLKLVSHRKHMGQCLSCSLSAVSLAAFSTRPNSRKMLTRACAVYSTALRLTNEKIQRPRSCEDDELVASVILLALFEVRMAT